MRVLAVIICILSRFSIFVQKLAQCLHRPIVVFRGNLQLHAPENRVDAGDSPKPEDVLKHFAFCEVPDAAGFQETFRHGDCRDITRQEHGRERLFRMSISSIEHRNTFDDVQLTSAHQPRQAPAHRFKVYTQVGGAERAGERFNLLLMAPALGRRAASAACAC